MRKTFTLDAKALAMANASRVLAILPSAIGAVLSLADSGADARATKSGTVAVVSILGPLAQRAMVDACAFVDGYDAILERFASAIANPAIDAVLLEIDSPGGDAAGLMETVRRMQEMRDVTGKPVVAYASEQAASAAYALAQVGNEFYLPASGEIGSIGCLCVHGDVSKALESEGVTMTIVRSGSRKAEHNPYEALSADARASLQSMVDMHAAQFADVVATARGGKAADFLALEGAVMMGKEAVKANLADKVMTYEGALQRAAALGKKWRKGQTMKSMTAKLGLSETATEAEVMAAIDRIDGERLSLRSDVAALLAAAGKETASEAIGEIAALQANTAVLAEVNEKLAAEKLARSNSEKSLEAIEVAALIEAAAAERKVVPATRAKVDAIYAKHGKAALVSHLDALVPVAPAAEVKEPETPATGAPPALSTKSHKDSNGPERAAFLSAHGKPAYEAWKAASK